MEDYKDEYFEWINREYFDDDTKNELKYIQGNDKEIEDRFFKELQFGTAGLRGIIGAGTNRMNIYTVRKATQGLADYIVGQGENAKNRGVVIAYDSRRMSREFSEEAALVLGKNGIKAYLYKELRATPQLSFTIRTLNCIAGIMVTASHNPAEYNGYKVYWEDGAQIATDQASGIIRAIDQIKDYGSIFPLKMDEAMKKGLFIYLEEDMDHAYIEEVKKQSLRRDMVEKVANDFKVVFTPLHGTGNIPVRRVLKEIGFKNVFVVPEQEHPDPEFSTIEYPNPEDKKAFKMAIELGKEKNAQLIIGTDPDCDRVGAVVKDKSGEYVILTGNQTGALLVDYIFRNLAEKKKIPPKGVIIKTIVTSEMGANIAESYGVETLNTLTGFKYIGEKIKEFEETGDRVFLFGYEESYGYLAGTYVRDKDAVVASMLICEMAAYYYSKGMNLYEALLALYEEYGYYIEGLKSITLAGKEGLEKIANIMDYFRENPPRVIGERKVKFMEDYALQTKIPMDQRKDVEQIKLPKENVMKFILEDDSWVCLRPSGTEPKLKIYIGIKARTMIEGQNILGLTMSWVENMIH